MADTITIRTDDETDHALDVLTHGGISRSAAIRQAVLEAADRRERAARMRREGLRMGLGEAGVVKLVHAEAESAALRGWLDERAETGWISSVLTEIESFRALARYAPEAASRLPAALDLIDLIPLDPPIHTLPQTARPATVRSLDAIHLGTALHARQALTSYVTYDKRLLDAVIAAGLPADSPV